MFKLLSKIIAATGTGFLALLVIIALIAAWLSLGAVFWGWIIMLIAGATGHSIGYATAFLWGYIPAILSGT